MNHSKKTLSSQLRGLEGGGGEITGQPRDGTFGGRRNFPQTKIQIGNFQQRMLQRHSKRQRVAVN
jgi:hypothetical protein